MNLSSDQCRILIDLARQSIYRAFGQQPLPGLPTDPDLHQPAGCFVSLHESMSHRLRGCVGRLDAKMPLAQVVAGMARAALEDPRFLNRRISYRELEFLEIELSILSPLLPMSGPEDFVPLEEGIYLTFGGRSGCFLPQVARSTGWGREQLLDRLCTEKMGLPAATWREPGMLFQKFTALLIGPEPFYNRLSSSTQWVLG